LLNGILITIVSIETLNIDKNWTLFLDRDGVINLKRENDYVKEYSEFIFIEGVLDAISILSSIFNKIIVVTNQRGVDKGLMSKSDLETIHNYMLSEIVDSHGRIDEIFYCTELSDLAECRKPNLGMAIQAKLKFPSIDFKKSIIVGDSLCDIQFGKKSGMKTVLVGSHDEFAEMPDFRFNTLHEFSIKLFNHCNI